MTPAARPLLAPQARVRFDKLSGAHILLAPERGFRLNASAAAILLLCDGQRSVLQIAQGLAPHQQEEQVLADVLTLIDQLKRRGLLKVTEP